NEPTCKPSPTNGSRNTNEHPRILHPPRTQPPQEQTMNRYILDGIFNDLAEGKTIALHANHKEAKEVFENIITSIPKPAIQHIRRVNGQERIMLHNGGMLQLIPKHYGSLRGHVPTALITDEPLDPNDETAMI